MPRSETMPKRIQLKRTRGWKMPANTVVVSRPSAFGNPFIVGKVCVKGAGSIKVETIQQALELYREQMRWWVASSPTLLDKLRGKNLACWCPLPKPGESDLCHAAILIELANAPRGG